MNKFILLKNNIKDIHNQKKLTRKAYNLYLLSLQNFKGCVMYEDFLGDEDIYNNNIIYKCSLSHSCDGYCSIAKKNKDIETRRIHYEKEKLKLKELKSQLFLNIFCR